MILTRLVRDTLARLGWASRARTAIGQALLIPFGFLLTYQNDASRALQKLQSRSRSTFSYDPFDLGLKHRHLGRDLCFGNGHVPVLVGDGEPETIHTLQFCEVNSDNAQQTLGFCVQVVQDSRESVERIYHQREVLRSDRVAANHHIFQPREGVVDRSKVVIDSVDQTLVRLIFVHERYASDFEGDMGWQFEFDKAVMGQSRLPQHCNGSRRLHQVQRSDVQSVVEGAFELNDSIAMQDKTLVPLYEEVANDAEQKGKKCACKTAPKLGPDRLAGAGGAFLYEKEMVGENMSHSGILPSFGRIGISASFGTAGSKFSVLCASKVRGYS